jgi:hypothetical protein
MHLDLKSSLLHLFLKVIIVMVTDKRIVSFIYGLWVFIDIFSVCNLKKILNYFHLKKQLIGEDLLKNQIGI